MHGASIDLEHFELHVFDLLLLLGEHGVLMVDLAVQAYSSNRLLVNLSLIVLASGLGGGDSVIVSTNLT